MNETAFNAVATHGASKIYGGVRRVDNVSMSVRKGEIYGLIGKNGAGKTTLIRLILGIASPDEGKIELNGKTLPAELAAERRKIGALIEQPAFYPRMSAAENIRTYSLATGLGKTDIKGLLSLVGLEDTGKKPVRNFSLGMKQRLAIAMALVGEPEILFLDEPVNGLDPTGILQVRELVRTLNEQRGTTVIISSHLLGELGKVATAYGVMKDGKMVKELRGEELTSLARPKIKLVAPDMNLALPVLRENFSPMEFAILNNGAIEIYRPTSELGRISILFAEAKVPLLQISAEESDSEAALVAMI